MFHIIIINTIKIILAIIILDKERGDFDLLDKSSKAFVFEDYLFFFYLGYINLLNYLIIRGYNFLIFINFRYILGPII